MKSVGKVLWFSVRDGNGIIVDQRGFEFYFDTSVIKRGQEVDRNSVVLFEENREVYDCRCAKKVELRGEVLKRAPSGRIVSI